MDQPSEPRLFGDPEVSETFSGVVYRFRTLPRTSLFGLKLVLVLLLIGMIPASAAVAALVFLLAYAAQLPWYLTVLSSLFVLQAGLLGGLCLRLAGRILFRRLLFDVFGRHELALHEGWLYWGKRAGPFRDGFRHAVADLRCLLVYCYTAAGSAEREAHFGVASLSTEEPTFYCCGCGEQEVLALARDLHRHLRQQSDVPLEVLETTEEEAWRRANPKGPPAVPVKRSLWQRRSFWYPWHVGGLIGLLALLAAFRTVALGLPPWVYFLVVLAILIELAALGNRPTG
jgi:hypothetical protein